MDSWTTLGATEEPALGSPGPHGAQGLQVLILGHRGRAENAVWACSRALAWGQREKRGRRELQLGPSVYIHTHRWCSTYTEVGHIHTIHTCIYMNIMLLEKTNKADFPSLKEQNYQKKTLNTMYVNFFSERNKEKEGTTFSLFI